MDLLTHYYFSMKKTVTITYRERPTPGFQSEFTYIPWFAVEHDNVVWFCQDTLLAFYLYHPAENFMDIVLDVEISVADGDDVKKTTWWDSDESDFRLFITNLSRFMK